MPQFAPVFDLATLNGANGFRIDGIDIRDLSSCRVAGAGDVNGDGFDDVIVGAYYADPGGIGNAGESYVVFGKASGFAAAIDLASLNGTNGFRLDGIDADDRSGIFVAAAGDVNGDGFGDLIIGADYADPGGNDSAGESYVVFGGASGFAAAIDLADLDGTNGFRLDGAAAGDRSGYSVASAGDVNGDGVDDLIVGAFRGGTSHAGQSYVVFGKGPASGGFAAAIDLAGLDGTNGFRLDGVDADDRGGLSVASAGDVNGDGFDDLIVGSPDGDPGGDTNAGETYVVFGKASGFAAAIDLADLEEEDGFRLDGIDAYDLCGRSVASAGDINGDGLDDMIVGAPGGDPGGDSNAGETYVIFGRATGFAEVIDLASLDGGSGFRLDGIDPNDRSGFSVAAAGDVNADGFDDLLIGAFYAGPGGDYFAGESYVMFGKASGFAAAIDLDDLNGDDGFRIDGIDTNDASGRSVASAGDVNADGFDDLVVGAFRADPGGNVNAGEGYVVFGHRALTSVAIIGTDRGLTHNGGFGDDAIDARDGDDTVKGWEGDDEISGGAGADKLDGGDGNDVMTGGSGKDVFIVSAGEDRIDGGSERDQLSFAAFGTTAVTLDLSTGQFLHPNGEDVQTFTSIENVVGSMGADTIIGDFKVNVLSGGRGGDTLHGAGGDDFILGGTGRDFLTGGTGKDTFDFNLSSESLSGSNNRDQNLDFTVDPAAGAVFVDRIDVSTIDAKAGLGGNQAFDAFIGTAQFSAEGQIRIVQLGANTVVQFNTTGTNGADFEVQLNAFTGSTLSLADFVL